MLPTLLSSLEQSDSFISWKKEHPDTFVSHFFVPISSSFQTKSSWEIGYFIVPTKKVTTFVKSGDTWSIKSADQLVAHTGSNEVTALDISSVTISFDDALLKAKEYMEKEFPGSLGILGDGFCILQHFKDTVLWNISFITKKLTMINVKLSALDGTFVSKDEVNFMGQ